MFPVLLCPRCLCPNPGSCPWSPVLAILRYTFSLKFIYAHGFNYPYRLLVNKSLFFSPVPELQTCQARYHLDMAQNFKLHTFKVKITNSPDLFHFPYPISWFQHRYLPFPCYKFGSYARFLLLSYPLHNLT